VFKLRLVPHFAAWMAYLLSCGWIFIALGLPVTTKRGYETWRLTGKKMIKWTCEKKPNRLMFLSLKRNWPRCIFILQNYTALRASTQRKRKCTRLLFFIDYFTRTKKNPCRAIAQHKCPTAINSHIQVMGVVLLLGLFLVWISLEIYTELVINFCTLSL
jgi:hypothetical protein